MITKKKAQPANVILVERMDEMQREVDYHKELLRNQENDIMGLQKEGLKREKNKVTVLDALMYSAYGVFIIASIVAIIKQLKKSSQ